MLDILETVDSPSLGHAFDPANYLEVEQPIDEAWSLLRSRVNHFHVKDYDTKLHKNVPAGEGQGQIARLIADAVAHGFSGFCVLEPHLIVAEQSCSGSPARNGLETRPGRLRGTGSGGGGV